MLGSHRFLTSRLAIVALALGASAATPETGSPDDVASSLRASVPQSRSAAQITELHPFTHVARIPAGADLHSIRFEGIRAVRVMTRQQSVSDAGPCDDRFADPGGSMYCPQIIDLAPVPAYEVSYSYRAPALASDEYGDTRFVFSVYFRPDELSAALREVAAAGRTRRKAAGFFEVISSNESTREIVVDPERSNFCRGNYTDGNWMHTDRNCVDQIVHVPIVSLSPYIALKVIATL
jgi:hypothetical protein